MPGKGKGEFNMGFYKVHSATILGLKVEFVQVEADAGNGLPMFHMVGYLSSEVKEAAERVRTAMRNAGYIMPAKKIVINQEGLCGRTTIFSDAFREGRRGLDQIGITIETHNPIDLLILMLGTNDCKTHFNASSKTIAKGLIQVIEKAKKYSSQPFELLIISPIHLGNGVGDDDFDPEFDLASEQVSRQLAQEYRKVATHYHAGFLDASKIALPSEIDREHLDESGHAALADAIYKTITESGLLEKGMAK